MNVELQPPRRVRRRGNQGALIAWLDEQERILRMRGVPAELVREFDPLHNLPEPPEVEEGRRTLEIKFDMYGGLNLESSIADQINSIIEERLGEERLGDPAGRGETGKTSPKPPQHRMVIRTYEGGVRQGHHGPTPSVPRTWASSRLASQQARGAVLGHV